jgi:hypothetical protein
MLLFGASVTESRRKSEGCSSALGGFYGASVDNSRLLSRKPSSIFSIQSADPCVPSKEQSAKEEQPPQRLSGSKD